MKINHRSELWKLLEFCSGDVAEVGVAEGRFSEEMLRWKCVNRIYMVDRWQCVPTQKGDASMPQKWHDKNYKEAATRIGKVGKPAHLLRGESVSIAQKYIADNTLILVYIDGDHSYTGVMTDLVTWVPKVIPRCYVALHDYLNKDYGVKQAVDEFCRSHGYVVNVIPEDKPEDAGAWFQIC